MSQQQLGYFTPNRRSSYFGWLRSERFRRATQCATIAAVCYIAAYAGLSTFGYYEPAVIENGGIGWYYWAPAGFAHDYHRRTGLFYAFLPLYLVDRAEWHVEGEAWLGRYPRHEPKNIDELRLAQLPQLPPENIFFGAAIGHGAESVVHIHAKVNVV